MPKRTIEPYFDQFLPERFIRWIESGIRSRFKTIPAFSEGDGSPEGVIDGIKADKYFDTTGNQDYIKTTDSGNTGWQLVDIGGGSPDTLQATYGASPSGLITLAQSIGGFEIQDNSTPLTTPATLFAVNDDQGDPIFDVVTASANVNVGRQTTRAGVPSEVRLWDDGVQVARTDVSAVAIIGTGVVVPTTVSTFDYDAKLLFENANNLQTASIGWDGTSTFEIEVSARNALFELRGIDETGVEIPYITVDPTDTLTIYEPAGGEVFSTRAVGINIWDGNLTGSPMVAFRDDPVTGTDLARIRVLNSNAMFIDARVAAMPISIRGTTTTVGDTTLLGLTPAGSQTIHNIAETIATTTTASAGGLLVNNLATGAGSERVLTTSDFGAGSFKGLGPWRYRTATTSTPSTGQLQFDNTTISSATNMYVNVTNDDSVDMSTFLALLVSGDRIYIQVTADASQYAIFQIGTPTSSAGVYTFPISAVAQAGSAPANNTVVSLVI